MENEPQTLGKDWTRDLWEIEKYQFEELKFADQKAIALLGISDLIAAAVNYFFMNAKADPDAPTWGLLVIGNLCAICATVAAIGAINPRGKLNTRGLFGQNTTLSNNPDVRKISLIHLTRIAAYPTPSEYLAEFQGLSKGEIDDQLAIDIHRMAQVARDKYRWIIWAVGWATGEFIALLAGLTLAIILRHFGVQ